MIKAGLTSNRSMLVILSNERDLEIILDSILVSISLSKSCLSFKVSI